MLFWLNEILLFVLICLSIIFSSFYAQVSVTKKFYGIFEIGRYEQSEIDR